MSKLVCLLNNQNPGSLSKCFAALDYHPGWLRSSFSSSELFLGCFDLPFKPVEDYWLETDEYVLAMDGEILSADGDQKQPGALKLLQLFVRYGEDLVHHINGAFSILIWDRIRKVLFVLNDRIGLRPLYFALYSGKICFASEIKAILADQDFSVKINRTALLDFFSYEYVLGNDTLVSGIEVFPNACVARIDPENLNARHRRYWDFQYAPDIDRGAAEFGDHTVQTFKDVLTQAVERAISGNLRTGLLLSGGLDSRMIAGVIGDLQSSRTHPIDTFTFGEKRSDDVRFAKRVSKAIQSNHHYTGVQYARLPEFFQKAVFYQDGMVSCNHCHYFHMLDELEKNTQIALDGFAGDVLPRQMFRSFISGGFEKALAAFQTISGEMQRRIFDASMQTEIAATKERFHSLWQESFAKSPQNPLDHFNLTQRQRKFINYGKISKRNHVEVRTPFTDYDLLDYSLALPRHFRVNDRICKEFFYKFYPRLARIPQAEAGPFRAGKLKMRLYRKFGEFKERRKWKIPMMNYESYYRSALRDFVNGILLTRAFKDRGYFNYPAIQQMLDDHFEGKSDHKTLIGVLLTFELWCRFFVDRTLEMPGL